MRKTEKGGLLLFGFGILDKGLDWLARAGGIHADTPDLFGSAWRMISGAFEFLGFSGLAIIAGLAIFAWGRWGDKVGTRWATYGSAQAESSRANDSDVPDAIGEKLVQLWDALNRTSAFVSEISDRSDRIQTLEIQAALLRDVFPRIDAVDQKLTTTLASLEAIRQDVDVLLYYCTINVTYQILLVALSNSPRDIAPFHEHGVLTEESVIEQTRLANEYAEYVSMKLGGTRWARDLFSVVQRAEAQYVADMPLEKRPANIDPYKFREYGIALTKYDLVLRFLREKQDDSEQLLRSIIVALQERMRERG